MVAHVLEYLADRDRLPFGELLEIIREDRQLSPVNYIKMVARLSIINPGHSPIYVIICLDPSLYTYNNGLSFKL